SVPPAPPTQAPSTATYTVLAGSAPPPAIPSFPPRRSSDLFAAGDLTQIITVGTANDSIDESNETVTVTLTNPSGAAQATPVIGTSAATGTIVDNDTATIDSANAAIAESRNLLFTVSRTTTSQDPQTGNYTVAAGTASAADITGGLPLTGTVTFAAGDRTQIITVGTANDSIDESNETVTVTLTNPSGAAQATPVIGTSAATGTIVDNDTAT